MTFLSKAQSIQIGTIALNTDFSRSEGMTSSGRSDARFCRAIAESELPVLLNIAMNMTGDKFFTNKLTSSSVSLAATGISGSQVFLLHFSLYKNEQLSHQ